MTYPTRQWDAEQQDAIARVQLLRALREIRKTTFLEVNVQADAHGANLLIASRLFVRDAMPGSAPATSTHPTQAG